MRRLLLRAVGAVLSVWCASAGAAPSCEFGTPKGLSIGFGTLDPSNPVTRTVSAAGDTVAGRCGGGQTTMTISFDDGQHFSGGSRNLAGPGGGRIAYDLNPSPVLLTAPGNRNQSFTFSATVLGAAYVDAPAGAYSDTVIVSLSP